MPVGLADVEERVKNAGADCKTPSFHMRGPEINTDECFTTDCSWRGGSSRRSTDDRRFPTPSGSVGQGCGRCGLVVIDTGFNPENSPGRERLLVSPVARLFSSIPLLFILSFLSKATYSIFSQSSSLEHIELLQYLSAEIGFTHHDWDSAPLVYGALVRYSFSMPNYSSSKLEYLSALLVDTSAVTLVISS